MKDHARQLLRELTRELFQTETSASWHARREARRLGASPPGWALAAVADHADGVLRELPKVAKNHGLPVSAGGHITGRLFSAARHALLDRLIDAERSYRGTLLGIRHGVDVVTMMHHVASALDEEELAHWCWHWLGARSPLMERVDAEMAWFATHPAEATRAVGLLAASG